MSTATYQRRLESINRDLGQLHKRLAEERKREADKLARIGQVERSITRNTSLTTIQSKAREVERYHKDIEQSKRKQADITKRIATTEKQKHDCERSLLNEQVKEQRAFRSDQQRRLAKFQTDLRRTTEAATSPVLQSSVPSTSKTHDAFISHASEDKKDFVQTLAESLRARGLNVWYDEFELKVGDSLRRSIDRGLADSRFGIVVLSPNFFKKNWPQYELDGLVTKEVSAVDKVILPIWHTVTKDEVASYSPTLADKVALNTGVHTLDDIVAQLVAVIQPPNIS